MHPDGIWTATRGAFSISTDPALLDRPLIYEFLSRS